MDTIECWVLPFLPFTIYSSSPDDHQSWATLFTEPFNLNGNKRCSLSVCVCPLFIYHHLPPFNYLLEEMAGGGGGEKEGRWPLFGTLKPLHELYWLSFSQIVYLLIGVLFNQQIIWSKYKPRKKCGSSFADADSLRMRIWMVLIFLSC